MKLYNTLTRKKEEFKSIKPKQVSLYSCGPTVYNYAHIGNLRSYIFSDILRRALEYNDFKVKQVINITDVGHLTDDADQGDDKLEKEAKLQKKSAKDIAKFYEKVFLKDLEELNIEKPFIMPHATKHIKEQIALIKKLEKKGFTYKISDGVYFDTSKNKDYGKLSGQKLADKKAGIRVKLSSEKKNPTDFALWKFSSKNIKRQMEWISPWGVGFPGWHIECSAMSVKFLGQPFDIHTGGIDHIAVHHSNEIAQSESANNKLLANYWMHNEFLTISGGKMAKSENNFLRLNDLIKKGYSPLVFRYYVLQSHYRKNMNFTDEGLIAANNALQKLWLEVKNLDKPKIGCTVLEKKFLKAINDDLNTPKCLAVVWETLKSKNPSSAKAESLFRFDKVLGLGLEKYWQDSQKLIKNSKIIKLAKKREEARKNKNYKEADRLRNEIKKQGYEIEDTIEGGKIIKI